MYKNVFFDGDKYEIHLWDDKNGYTKTKYKKYGYILDSKGDHISIDGKKLKRVSRWSDTDYEDGLIYEGDVGPEMRVIIDNYLDEDDPPVDHVEMILDIEVSMEEGVPDSETAMNEITAISFYVSDKDKYKALILDKDNRIKNSINGNVEIYSYKRETDLLVGFLSMYLDSNPTIITGWNIDYFDIPYLFHRIKKILGNDSACLLSPVGVIKWSNYRRRYRIAGVSSLDYLALYKNFTFSQEPSYSLEFISNKELGFGKIKYDGSLGDLYKNDINKFIEYNINDVKLVKLIDDKMRFIELTKGICHKCHTVYEDIYYSSKILEGALLTYMKKINMIAPSKNPNNKFSENNEKFEGAYVKAPIPGKYDWIFDLDMTSLYPSVIMTLNISPETKIGKVIGWNGEEFIKNVEKTYTVDIDGKKTQITNSELKRLLDESKFSISSNGILYDMSKKGIIPAILELWYRERVEYRELMKKYSDAGNKKMYNYFNQRQYIQKVLLNSLYGVLGLQTFRFYDVDNAEATTISGQEVIKYSERMVNYYYNKALNTDNKDYVIYVDTDSNYISAIPLLENRYPNFNEFSEDEVSKNVIGISTEIQSFINNSFDLFCKKFLNVTKKHHFNIKQEIVAKSGLWLSKKRYALWAINDNGIKVDKMIAKGIDVVRSDFPPAFTDILNDVIKDILFNSKKENIDDKLLTFKKKILKLGLIDVAKSTSVQNITKYMSNIKNSKYIKENTSGLVDFKNYSKGTPVHVKASIMYNNMLKHYNLTKKYKKIENAEKIKWVYLKSNEFGIESLAFRGYNDPPEIIKFIEEYVDNTKMFNSILMDKLETLYESMSWKFDIDKEESSLGNFFKF